MSTNTLPTLNNGPQRLKYCLPGSSAARDVQRVSAVTDLALAVKPTETDQAVPPPTWRSGGEDTDQHEYARSSLVAMCPDYYDMSNNAPARGLVTLALQPSRDQEGRLGLVYDYIGLGSPGQASDTDNVPQQVSDAVKELDEDFQKYQVAMSLPDFWSKPLTFDRASHSERGGESVIKPEDCLKYYANELSFQLPYGSIIVGGSDDRTTALRHPAGRSTDTTRPPGELIAYDHRPRDERSTKISRIPGTAPRYTVGSTRVDGHYYPTLQVEMPEHITGKKDLLDELTRPEAENAIYQAAAKALRAFEAFKVDATTPDPSLHAQDLMSELMSQHTDWQDVADYFVLSAVRSAAREILGEVSEDNREVPEIKSSRSLLLPIDPSGDRDTVVRNAIWDYQLRCTDAGAASHAAMHREARSTARKAADAVRQECISRFRDMECRQSQLENITLEQQRDLRTLQEQLTKIDTRIRDVVTSLDSAKSTIFDELARLRGDIQDIQKTQEDKGAGFFRRHLH